MIIADSIRWGKLMLGIKSRIKKCKDIIKFKLKNKSVAVEKNIILRNPQYISCGKNVVLLEEMYW